MDTKTEIEMREADVPRFDSIDALADYIRSLTNREHDYGTCVYAMSMAATAAFNYVAGKLGASGFQASCADMDIIRRTRHMDCPFMLVRGEDALYPQYDVPGKVAEFLNYIRPWLAEKAAANLEKDAKHASPNVVAHWRALARCVPAELAKEPQ